MLFPVVESCSAGAAGAGAAGAGSVGAGGTGTAGASFLAKMRALRASRSSSTWEKRFRT